MKPPFKYYGGKSTLAPTIAAMLPPHTTYVETYAGSGAVLFAKRPAKVEILNDLNGAIVAFYRMVRDRPEDLLEAIRWSPYARGAYIEADLLEDGLDELELARRWWVRISQSFGGIVNPGEINWSSSGTMNKARAARRAIPHLEAISGRMQDVTIDNRDAVKIVEVYGHGNPDAAIYLDPPYLGETRADARGYFVDDAQGHDHHRALAEAARACPGFVMVSGYHSPLYDELFEGWYVHEKIQTNSAGALKGEGSRDTRTEVLWMNRPPADGRLF